MAPPAMRQKHSCRSRPVDHPPAEPRPVGLVERVVVEEVAVLVARQRSGHPRSDGQTIPVAVCVRPGGRSSPARRRRGGGCRPARQRPGRRRATALAIMRVVADRPVDDPLDLGLVGVGRQQRGEVVGTEQPAEHLAVQLDQQRVAAGPGDGGVERRGRGRGSRPAPCRVRKPLASAVISARSVSEARSAASSMIGSSSVRRVSNSWRTNSLRSSRRSPSTRTSGSRSATYERLPLRSMTPEREQALHRLAHRRAGDAELLGQPSLGRHAGSRLELAAGDPLDEAIADQRAQASPGRSARRRCRRAARSVRGRWRLRSSWAHGRSAGPL